ncbi:hypothetical protein [Krasilnikovia sp. MM14-A1259]|uniref:hypothetical protein n=1 Tax=Krasilnikovia sp. MM14-A1259 TaxID=3373539 RepID=UPI00381F2A40
MPLTSLPLIVLAFLATAIVVAGTVWVWGRSWRLRFLLRTAGVLLIEALLLISVGLVVNREEDFYPTWDALVASDSGGSAAPVYHAVAGSLDQQLATLADARSGQPQALPWKPEGWTGWRLAAAPTLVVPAGYLRHPQWRYSVVLVVANAAPSWPAVGQDTTALRVAAGASSDVVVYVTTTPGTTAQTLTTSLPERLDHDLRVTGHRWAVVTASADAPLVRQAVVAAAAQYPAVATVYGDQPSPSATKKASSPGGRKPPSRPTAKSRPARARTTSTDVTVGTAAAATVGGRVGDKDVPAGIATFVSRSGSVPVALATAVTWAGGQTPPPLAASSPPVRFLPVTPPRSRASSGPSAAPTGKDQGHGSGQRRH